MPARRPSSRPRRPGVLRAVLRGSAQLLLLALLLLVVLAPSRWAAAAQDVTMEDAVAMVQQGRQLVDGRRFQEAARLLEQVLALDASNPEAHVQLGRAHAFQGALEEAEARYRQALAIDGSYAPARTALGKLFMFQSRYPEAKVELEKALAAHPKDGEVLVTLARLEAHSARDADGLRRAEGLYQRGLQLVPENEQALFDYGIVLSQLGKLEEAHASFDAAIALNPTVNYTLLGDIYAGFGQVKYAFETYGTALDHDPSDIASLRGYAGSAEALGLQEDAEAAYEALLALAPGDAAAHASYGAMLTGTGVLNYAAQQACGLNREAAVAHYRQALQIDPSLEAAKQALAFCESEARDEALWAERVAQLKADMADVLSGTSDADAPVPEPEPAAAEAEVEVEARELQAPAAASEEGAAPLQVLRRLVLGQLRSALRLLQQLMERITALLAALRGGGQAAAARAGGGGKAGFGVWINGQRIRTIPAVRITSARELMEKYVRPNKPVVIKNFQEQFAPAEAWTREALKATFGDRPVRVSLSQTGRFDGPEDGTLWGLGADEEVLVRPPQVTMRFADFADLLHLAAVSQRAGSGHITETFYLEYLSLSQYLGPELLAMIPMPAAARDSGMEHFLTNFWMGKGNTTSPLHYDDYENLLCQIRGVKELTLFPPSDIAYLYYTGRAKGLLEYEYPGQFARRTLASDKGVNVVFGSSVYLDAPDLAKHPDLPKATPYKVRLEPGDVLYLPAYWHHEVTSHPDPVEKTNIAINYWFRNETAFAEEAAGLAAAARAKAQARRRQQQQQQQQQ